MNQTFVIAKPDAVRRGLVGEIIRRFEAKGLTIAAAELRTIDEATAKAHYAEHDGKPFFGGLVDFITGGPSMLMVLQGPDDTWEIVRTMMGVTNPAKSAPGTIRGDFGTEVGENLIHGSDSAESAAREISIFFPEMSR